jgi:two-component system chemotaxis response regulator CheY
MGKRILIVDDSSIMRKMISETLKSGKHEIVGEAKSGADAVEMYRALSPDLVTMDITMRDMDGFSAAQEILAYDRNAKIIFLSNLDEQRYGEKIRQIGALAYINKHNANEILSFIEKSVS